MPGLAMDIDGASSEPIIKEDSDAQPEFAEDEDEVEDTEYRSREKLPEANACLRSVKSIFDMHESGLLDLDPEYQRQVVWPAKNMSGLVNSLMENYYIPPVIFNKYRRPDGRVLFVCVDGKQRLTSVISFMRGLISCTDHRNAGWWYCNTTSHARRVLSEHARREFEEKEFMCFEYWELTAAQEEDLFARVQKGVPLTAAEKMRAHSGPWHELAKAFVNDFSRVFGITRKCQSPATNFQLVMACFTQIIEVRNPSTANAIPALKSGPAAINAFLESKPDLDENIRSHLGAVFRKLDRLVELDPEIFQNTRRLFASARSFRTVEFVAATVLISQYMEKRDDEVLLEDIQGLREHLHIEQHRRQGKEESRVTKQAWMEAWEYIDDLERIRGATDGTAFPTAQATRSRAELPQVQAASAQRRLTVGGSFLPTPRTTPATEAPLASRTTHTVLTVKGRAKRKAPSSILNEAAARAKLPRGHGDVKFSVANQPQQAPSTPHASLGGFDAANSAAYPSLEAQLAVAANTALPPPNSNGGPQVARRSTMPYPALSATQRPNSVYSQTAVQTQMAPTAGAGPSLSSPSTKFFTPVITPVTPTFSTPNQAPPLRSMPPLYPSTDVRPMTTVQAAQTENIIDLTGDDDEEGAEQTHPVQTAARRRNPTETTPKPPQLAIRTFQPHRNSKGAVRRPPS